MTTGGQSRDTGMMSRLIELAICRLPEMSGPGTANPRHPSGAVVVSGCRRGQCFSVQGGGCVGGGQAGGVVVAVGGLGGRAGEQGCVVVGVGPDRYELDVEVSAVQRGR
jgi:hypothetical protein